MIIRENVKNMTNESIIGKKKSQNVIQFLKDNNISDKIGLISVLLILFIGLSIMQPAFTTSMNLMNILLSASTVGIVACGVTFVILAGGLDLSVGSITALSGTTVAILINTGMPLLLAVLLAFLVGAALGGLNGFFITNIGVNPLITTLGTMMVYRGFAFIVSGGTAVYILNDNFIKIGTGRIASIPNPVIVMIFTFLVFMLILSKTLFGRNLFVIGGNREAARLCGINTKFYSYAIYIISSLMATLSGVILAGRMTSGQPTSSNGLELDAVTAVVLGGAALTGGEGSMMGTILGVIILSVFRNGLLLFGVDAFYQYVASGALLLFAVTLDQLRHRKNK
jgi:ribose/xylose/arabinose/galactoside ABC-type transport system permease subunit